MVSTNFTGLFNQRFLNNFVPIPATNNLSLGRIPPDFELPDITSDRLVKLSSYRGVKPVLVDFTRIFTEHQYCPLCYPHIQALNDSYEQFVAKGVEVLMITSTDKQQSQKVVKDLGLKMPLLSDPSCFSFRAYHVGQALGAPLPAQFLLDREGKIRYKHLFSFLSPNAEIETLLKILEEI
ncbi:MAG: redoxin domain-containing protein [Cyanosarcina radialis HA8281-LM2]|nr:redoxin domain-containing protein [Cyanosarcina radialis HA8281-LM2]